MTASVAHTTEHEGVEVPCFCIEYCKSEVINDEGENHYPFVEEMPSWLDEFIYESDL